MTDFNKYDHNGRKSVTNTELCGEMRYWHGYHCKTQNYWLPKILAYLANASKTPGQVNSLRTPAL